MMEGMEQGGDGGIGRIRELEAELERLQAEKTRLEAAAGLRYHNLFENSPVSIWEEDFTGLLPWFAELRKQGVEDLEAYLDEHPEEIVGAASRVHIVGVNRAARDLLGLAPDASLEGSFGRIFKQETTTIFSRELVGLWHGDSDMVFEHSGRRADGELYHYLLHMHVPVLPAPEGTRKNLESERDLDLGCVIVAITDITALKRAETLQAEVERMTCHDLKTPLQLVIGMPDVLLAEPDFDEVHRNCLQQVQEAGYRMLEMINLTLDMHKMEQGGYSYTAVPVDMVRQALRVAEELSPVLRSGRVRVEILHKGEPAGMGRFSVMGEELLCYSILANLIKNAVEATPRGGIVCVDMIQRDGACITSIHNPMPVPEQVREIFFDKFSTAGKANGAGLGTYSARLMARSLGGDVTMRTDNEGTMLRVMLPADNQGAYAHSQEART